VDTYHPGERGRQDDHQRPQTRAGIIKQANGYSSRVELPRDPATGKRGQKWYGPYRTREAASRARPKIFDSLNQGSFVEPTAQTTPGYLGEWLVAVEPTIPPSTLHSYSRNLQLHVIEHIGTVPLQRLDAVGLNALSARLLAKGKRGHAGGLSPRTVRYIHTIVGRALKDAVRWGRLVRDPADLADPPRLQASGRPEIPTWTVDVLTDFLGRSKDYGDRYYPLWVVLATTGARRGEILGLRWGDLDLKAGRAAVRQPVIAVAHDVRFGQPKTPRGWRSLSLDPGTVDVLRVWRLAQLEERAPGQRPRFRQDTGEALHPERVSREFDRRVERWDLPRITLHGPRHR
jgi:integrase